MTETKTCYMCDNIGTTREHIPPKCLFPEYSDNIIQGNNHRKNLITVPSCEEHNNAKSNNDEYLRDILSMTLSANSTGLAILESKTSRSFNRNPKRIEELKKSAIPALLTNFKSQKTMYVFGVKINRARLVNTLDMCFRGLYYHEYNEKFNGDIGIIPLFLIDDKDQEYNHKLNNYESLINEFFLSVKQEYSDYSGENPDVFKYYFYKIDQENLILDVLFYQNLRIISKFKR